MRLLMFTFILVLIAACGKDGGGGGSKQRQEASTDLMWDGRGIEIKEAVMEVPATVNSSQIVFNMAKTNSEQGAKIKCAVSVNNGETYHYSVNGDTLYLQTNNGNHQLSRVNGSGGVYGTWSTTFRTSGNERIEFKVFVSKNNVILRKTCEG